MNNFCILALNKSLCRWNETALNKVMISGVKLYTEWAQFFDADGLNSQDYGNLKSCKYLYSNINIHLYTN